MPPTSDLNFDGLMFEKNWHVTYRNATSEQRLALKQYLKEQYGGYIIMHSPPFLVIECERENAPDDETRPFSIGGMIVIWCTKGDQEGFAELQTYMGQGSQRRLPGEVSAMFDGCKLPVEDAILYLASVTFPDCEALSFISGEMIVEFPEQDEISFGARLDALPNSIIGLPFSLVFHNGSLPKHEQATHIPRAVKPPPQKVDAKGDVLVSDHTNSIQSEGKFFPGMMIASTNERDGNTESCFATAGVLAQRGLQERLICSHHLWDGQVKVHRSLVGSVREEAQHAFQLLQGTPGAPVGFLRERIGITDLGLVQLHANVKFENTLMDSESTLKTFVHSRDQDTGDQYVFNSYVTGEHKLQRVGTRFKFGERIRRGQDCALRVSKALEHVWPEDAFAYISLKQVICATNEHILTRDANIRGGVCGSVLVRTFDAARARRGVRESEREVFERGECCAMMHFADLQSRHGPGSMGDYFIFADTFDPLIDEGWQVVPVERAV